MGARSSYSWILGRPKHPGEKKTEEHIAQTLKTRMKLPEQI
jgi:hypothetical protein